MTELDDAVLRAAKRAVDGLVIDSLTGTLVEARILNVEASGIAFEREKRERREPGVLVRTRISWELEQPLEYFRRALGRWFNVYDVSVDGQRATAATASGVCVRREDSRNSYSRAARLYDFLSTRAVYAHVVLHRSIADGGDETAAQIEPLIAGVVFDREAWCVFRGKFDALVLPFAIGPGTYETSYGATSERRNPYGLWVAQSSLGYVTHLTAATRLATNQ